MWKECFSERSLLFLRKNINTFFVSLRPVVEKKEWCSPWVQGELVRMIYNSE